MASELLLLVAVAVIGIVATAVVYAPAMRSGVHDLAGDVSRILDGAPIEGRDDDLPRPTIFSIATDATINEADGTSTIRAQAKRMIKMAPFVRKRCDPRTLC